MAGVGGDECVVGVDFGTLSARAVVVRAHDGEELGSAVHEYPHAVIEHAPFRPQARDLPPQWALQDPADWVQALQIAVPAAVAAAGVRPEEVVGIATDFTASTPLPVLADGTPAVPSARAGRAAPTPIRSSGSTTPPSVRPTASTRWPRSAESRGWRATAGGSRRSGSSPRRFRCSRRIPRSTRAWTAGSRAPIGSSGSSAAARPATRAPPATRPSTKTATTRRRTIFARSTSASPGSSRTRSRGRCHRSANVPAT